MTTSETAQPPPELEVADLRVAYGDLVAVWEASLQLTAGSITALVGRNGAGKSTLLSGICGLLPSKSGVVRLAERDVSSATPWERVRRGLTLVQEGKRIFRELTVRENLVLGVRSGRAKRGETHERLDALYTRFPVLAERRNERGGSLSGGQQQILAIATAVAARPRVLLVDEPSSGLAPMFVDRVFEVLQELRSEGMAILLVEQLVEEVLGGIADDVIVLERGRVTLRGSASDLSTDRVAKSIYSSA
jgi:branched-chain amino acid transport system ATP-binding protein